MNDKQTQKKQINVMEGLKHVAIGAWVVGTYCLIQFGVAAFAASTSSKSAMEAAVTAVIVSSLVNWVIFLVVADMGSSSSGKAESK